MIKPRLLVLTLGLVLVTGATAALAQRGQQAGHKDHAAKLRKLDANGDGAISRQEAQGRGEKLFAKLDANHDGLLSSEELKAAQQDRRKGVGSKLFSKMDTNGDGSIQAGEFRGDPEQFARLDTNQDGSLTREELGRAAHLGKGKRIGKLFETMDANDDNKIERSEFRGNDQQFARLDENNDGWLSRGELQKAAKR